MSDKTKVGDRMLLKKRVRRDGRFDNLFSSEVLIECNIIIIVHISPLEIIYRYYNDKHGWHCFTNRKNIIKITSKNNPCPTCKERLRCLTK